MEITTGQLANLLNGIVEGDNTLLINRPSKIEEGGLGSITFLSNPKYESYIYSCTASAIIVDKKFVPVKPINITLIRVSNVPESLLFLMQKFDQKSNSIPKVSNNASVSSSSVLGNRVSIGDYSVIADGANIGDQTVIYPQVYIGEEVNVGKNCIIYPGVKLMSKSVIGDNCIIHANTVIGSDGFGFSKSKDGSFKKIPQLGNVVIEDNVEIGGSCVIDRATLGSTIIRKGVKLDNLVHIAHNVEIGKNAAIAGQCGIAGSAKIGKDCMMGGQVGVAGHISVADGTQIQAKSGIAGAVKIKNSKLYGYPAIDYGDYLRSYAGFKQLPDLMKRIKELEKNIKK